MEKNFARMIDHTLLKAEATKEQIDKLCAEAKQFNFASVCVNPTWVKRSSELLEGTDVLVCTVMGSRLVPIRQQSKHLKQKMLLLTVQKK